MLMSKNYKKNNKPTEKSVLAIDRWGYKGFQFKQYYDGTNLVLEAIDTYGNKMVHTNPYRKLHGLIETYERYQDSEKVIRRKARKLRQMMDGSDLSDILQFEEESEPEYALEVYKASKDQ